MKYIDNNGNEVSQQKIDELRLWNIQMVQRLYNSVPYLTDYDKEMIYRLTDLLEQIKALDYLTEQAQAIEQRVVALEEKQKKKELMQ